YCVIAVESAGRQIPISFLEEVKDEFTKEYGGGIAATVEINKLAKVKAQVSEVKGVMMENIEMVSICHVVLWPKISGPRVTKIRRKMWWENMKIKMVVTAIIVALILILILSICGGFKCTHK
ncbi:hypothetical protein RDABS01_017040, partial [Bienertia sinuspersici]